MTGSSSWCTRSARLRPIRERDAVVGELAEHPGLGDRVVRAQGGERPQVALDRVHPVGEHAAAASAPPAPRCTGRRRACGSTPDRPFGGLRRAEDRREERVLDRPLPRPLLRLPLRELPVRAGQRPVLELQLRAPTGGPPGRGRRPSRGCAPAAGRWTRRAAACRGRVGHRSSSSQAALGTTSGLMQSSSLAEKMW